MSGIAATFRIAQSHATTMKPKSASDSFMYSRPLNAPVILSGLAAAFEQKLTVSVSMFCGLCQCHRWPIPAKPREYGSLNIAMTASCDDFENQPYAV